jgi:succinyl-diaminopimelate desuccinylase
VYGATAAYFSPAAGCQQNSVLEMEPLASGGAAYARAIDNCVAFGALFPGTLLTEHQPNEHVVLDDLYKAMEIYAHALYELTRY